MLGAENDLKFRNDCAPHCNTNSAKWRTPRELVKHVLEGIEQTEERSVYCFEIDKPIFKRDVKWRKEHSEPYQPLTGFRCFIEIGDPPEFAEGSEELSLTCHAPSIFSLSDCDADSSGQCRQGNASEVCQLFFSLENGDESQSVSYQFQVLAGKIVNGEVGVKAKSWTTEEECEQVRCRERR